MSYELGYTKGDWEIKHSESKTAFNIVGTVLGGKYKIARCPYVNECDKPEAKANASLIAAAPKMFELLKEVVEQFERVEPLYSKDKQIIAKAHNLLTEITK